MSLLQSTGIPPLEDACGTDPGAVCRFVFEQTDSIVVAEFSDWLVAKPLKVILIIVGAWIARRILHKLIGSVVTEISDGEDTEVTKTLRRVRRRTPGVQLLSIDRSGGDSLRAAARAETMGLVLRSTASAVVYSIAFMLILGEVGINLAPLLAGAGIVGVAVGFGAQTLVRDFLSGIFMLAEDQYGVGDVVDLGEATGVVEAVNLRTTRLRSVDGTVWHIPNGEVHRVGNMSQQWARALVDVEVAYDTDLEKAQTVVKAVADELASSDGFRELILEEPEVWGVQNLGADGIAIRVVIKTLPGEQFGTTRELRRRLKDRFDIEGIEIPFPQRVMWVRREPGSSKDAGSDDEDVPELSGD